MKLQWLLGASLLAVATAASAENPDFYLRGPAAGGWENLSYQFSRNGNDYSIKVASLNGEFKISNPSWTINYGAESPESVNVEPNSTFTGMQDGLNFVARNLSDVEISFTYTEGVPTTQISVRASGGGDIPDPVVNGVSGTLPVLYINVYDEQGNLNNEIISKDLPHKNYFSGNYWLELNGCQWMADLGAESIGSKEEPLPLEIKARGNYTRRAFAKKPFKLKLAKKQKLLGLSNSKHFAILAHADDNFGYLRNYTGFNLGRRMGLPWTPSQQPVEVVINGDYRGLYFLTESIRVEPERVNITELDDNCSDAPLLSGGYLIELDNYDEENQIRMEEKFCTGGFHDLLRVTFDTPEEYSDLQRRFITDQFSAMNEAVGKASDELWSYMDMDDAARYYIVREIMSDVEAFHGSTYMFRDRGDDRKWHFSPIWDCGNGFNGPSNDFFYNNSPFGNTWIASMRQNAKFNDKVAQTWKWFMSSRFDGIYDDMAQITARLKDAAIADRRRWKDAPVPSDEGQGVVDNTDMDSRFNQARGKLESKIAWLRERFGDFSTAYPEPQRDTTPAAALPDYVKPVPTPDPDPDPNPDIENPDFYLRGPAAGGWESLSYQFSRNGNDYSIKVSSLNGEFKISNPSWTINYGAESPEAVNVEPNSTLTGMQDGLNFVARNLSDVEISFTYTEGVPTTQISVRASGGGDIPDPVVNGISGTLPVLYINVYDEQGNLNNEIISKDLPHKNYFSGNYWLELNGCQWMADLGAESIGSKEEPLPLEIKARGNYTRRAFAKKPFKLKLAKKQKLLGLSNSKHFAILAHADDNFGYLRNYTGFNLGRRMGLPWTPSQQPVEVVINGDYRGLYFLTESIRVEPERVNITELDDNCSDAPLLSGGYLIELDNYDEENQIRMEEKFCTGGFHDLLRVTFDTPEEYSDLQRRFITDQFSAMNEAVGKASDELWSYMDMDDAARYYIVREIMSDVEAFHGSTYMFRDRGDDRKWHFSPIWDCGNGFNGPSNDFFYNNSPFGNTWIASMRQNAKFNDKVAQTWKWFMSSRFDGIYDDMAQITARLKDAAIADRRRWKDAPVPSDEGQGVVDNTDMDSRFNQARGKLESKIAWLRERFGDFSTAYPEPQRDTTPAAALPDYIISTGMDAIESDSEWLSEGTQYFDLQGNRLEAPLPASICIAVTPKGKAAKILVKQ
ncbi:MAG: CotH kinase family protein [Muribaculaceae bacterium]|nr:CotH kinase family protein [Muribaculaceae bacterium]